MPYAHLFYSFPEANCSFYTSICPLSHSVTSLYTQGDSSALSGGAIAAIATSVVVIILIVMVVVMVVMVLVKKRKSKKVDHER